MMIIGLKSAGLGNCMFQYAAAKSLAIQNDTIVKFGIINFKKQQMPYKRGGEGLNRPPLVTVVTSTSVKPVSFPSTTSCPG